MIGDDALRLRADALACLVDVATWHRGDATAKRPRDCLARLASGSPVSSSVLRPLITRIQPGPATLAAVFGAPSSWSWIDREQHTPSSSGLDLPRHAARLLGRELRDSTSTASRGEPARRIPFEDRVLAVRVRAVVRVRDPPVRRRVDPDAVEVALREVGLVIASQIASGVALM